MEQDNKGPTILTVMWAVTTVAVIFVIARVYTRIVVVKNLGVDDFLITLSMVADTRLQFVLCYDI
jgi:hypothetical protein